MTPEGMSGGTTASSQGDGLVLPVDGTCTAAREEIGGKAWGVNRMRALGLNVPPAFVVSTRACRQYHAAGRVLGDSLWARIVAAMTDLEAGTGRVFGGGTRPLLVSVRSGAARSMPGMMDTVLNLGMNAAVCAALGAGSVNPAHAVETQRTFEAQYRKVVLGGGPGDVPEDPWTQLRAAIAAVFDSWNSPRASLYRRARGIGDGDGTAVTVQAMVFGNLDERSGTGVLFSRNPITGDPPAWGEWLPDAQGEEVVSGRRTPLPLEVLRDRLPDVHAELLRGTAVLEADAGDIQDIEFTVESGRLWMLQTRTAKRSPQAALRAAVAFTEEGLIGPAEALARLDPEQVRHLPAQELAPGASSQPPVAIGAPACPGVASGVVETDPVAAESLAAGGADVILARPNTSPEDLQGIIAARALVTEQGGSTSHAAVVSRELGRPCVVGCGARTVTRLAGQRITVDGASGRVWEGDLTVDRTLEATNADLRQLVAWGLPLVPLALISPDASPPDAVDLDACGDDWPAMLKPGSTVRGRVLESDAGIVAALRAGVRAAVVRHRLAAVVSCVHHLRATAATPAGEPASHPAPSAAPTDLVLLRLIALKGRAPLDVLADALGIPVDAVATACQPLAGKGWCLRNGDALRLTPAGRDHLAGLLNEERGTIDRADVLARYEAFCVLNVALKEIMTAWQIRPDGTTNDHADPAYDQGVLDQLAALHARAAPLLQRLAAIAGRLGLYAARLDRAMDRIAAGDRAFVARIIADSYHTVWFELHSDLLSIAGLTRKGEGAT